MSDFDIEDDTIDLSDEEDLDDDIPTSVHSQEQPKSGLDLECDKSTLLPGQSYFIGFDSVLDGAADQTVYPRIASLVELLKARPDPEMLREDATPFVQLLQDN